jgi:translation initiation factor IF-2
MATQPQPTPPPKPPTPPPPAAKPAPAPVKTIADEQRERSEEIQREGVEAWKAKHDERTEDDKKGRVVTGVAHRPVDAAVEASRR